ncbi:MAG: pyrroloquinoline quinone biosynthesis protein PqqB [Woeseiaceae bacterium]|nr:pyrroloquinoline quinone biosynthesis protein PqqB [Woeseiaceae bacterium]
MNFSVHWGVRVLKKRSVFLLFLIISGVPLACADDRAYIVILGVAQDGGYPQTGCFRPHCEPAWQDPKLRRTVSAIAAIDEPSRKKFLFDATPDIGEQLYRLHRVAPEPVIPLSGVFLTHAHIGHYTGLMHFGHEAMGERDINVYAMPRMASFLAKNGPWDQLVRFNNIKLQPLAHEKAIQVSENIRVTPFLVPHRDEYSETVGYRIDGPNKSAIFIPDIDKWSKWDVDIRDLVRSVDYALIDATFFDNNELGGRDMSAVPHPFVSESMALFKSLTRDEKSRVLFIHMNHTNPLLQNDSMERQQVLEKGFGVAFEGMRLEL